MYLLSKTLIFPVVCDAKLLMSLTFPGKSGIYDVKLSIALTFPDAFFFKLRMTRTVLGLLHSIECKNK